jgi:uncharacterized protein with NRDE domain
MCLIFIALKQHPEYKLIIAANRDEFYQRKTAAAAFWSDHSHVLGGRDLEAGGTWLGVTTSGNPNAPSRGELVSDYLVQNVDPKIYVNDLETKADKYNGFNLLAGDTNQFYYLSNYASELRHLKNGLYGISNHLLETPWPKVIRGKEKMQRLLAHREFTTQDLFDVLFDDTLAPDTQLPDTGVGLERERMLSAMFIKSANYGTRCSTVITVDNDDNITFIERVYDLNSFQSTSGEFKFQVEKYTPLEKK